VEAMALAALFCAAAALISRVEAAAAAEEEAPHNLRASAQLRVAVQIDDVPPPCGALWTSGFMERGLTYERFAGAGASSCVYIAKDQDGARVAVKISKEKGRALLLAFKRECGDMHLLRLAACGKGQEFLGLHEAFMPTCIEAGEVDGLPFIIMHAAPTDPIGEVGRSVNLAPEEQKVAFAEMVAAIFALHGVGKAHNDLHGQNIVLDEGANPPQLTLIDFGDMTPLDEGNKDGYKRDGNAIWRWTAVLAGCDASSQWLNNAEKMEAAKPNLLKCLRDKWQADDELVRAVEDLADADIAMSKDQLVVPVFRTGFVREHLPKLAARYHWSGSEGCLEWDDAERQDVENEAVFSAHFKCDTVPTFAEDPVKACSNHASKAACFSTKSDIYWACGAGLDPKVPCITVGLPPGGQGVSAGFYDGPCLMKGHPAYKFALDWEGGETPVEPRPTPKPKPEPKPKPGPKPVPDDRDGPATEPDGPPSIFVKVFYLLLLLAAPLGVAYYVRSRAPRPQARGPGAVEMQAAAS